MKLKKTVQFAAWYGLLTGTERTRIDARLDNLANGHLGNSRSLGAGLFELKWKNGMRVYYCRRRSSGADIIVLLGGFKGTQGRDIAAARRLQGLCEGVS